MIESILCDGVWARASGAPEVETPANAAYERVCGGCHMAWQPGLLPARSWRALLDGMRQHYGENVELDAEAAKEIAAFLKQHAAEASDSLLSKRLLASIERKETPMRITAIRYFVRRHHEVLPEMGKDNTKVRSMSNCVACHPRAATGHYEEAEVAVPGFGPWQQWVLHPEAADY